MSSSQIITTLLGIIVATSLPSCKRYDKSINTQNPTPSEVTIELTEKDTPVSFNEHIQPILSANCYHCHGPDSATRYPEHEPYRLDSPEGAFQVRKNGKPNIIKGEPDNSYLIKLIESKDPDLVMPLHPSKNPHGKIMDPADIALIRRWVKEGATFEDHWAYISPIKAKLPKVTNEDWPRNPIDHFILAKLERKGLEPNKDQDKARLLRRLTLDLTGLPPTPEELEAFINDHRDLEIIYSEKVNALLHTDAYAEHFARHWLDVARYADTHGIHKDNYRSIWPYRDWVIQAFRKNMKFDQFTLEQIAGDMLPNPSIQQKIATGFHRCLPTTGEGGSIAEEYHAIYAQDRVDTTAAVWLGLTAGCAACHDHKFDAITTKENYQLTAFFRNTPMSALDKNKADHPPNILIPIPSDTKKLAEVNKNTKQLTQQLKQHRSKNQPAFKTWIASQQASPESPPQITPHISTTNKIKALIKLTKKTPKQLNQIREYYFSNIDKVAIKLQESLTKNAAKKAAITKRGVISLIMQEKPNSKPKAHILIRGQYSTKGQEVTPNTPASLPPMTSKMPKNRLGLAIWLTDPKNPLPARVTVNRYWHYFFGTGIVSSNSDFGVMGARPTHPKLLDWLAVDFVEKKWDLHHLIKNIVMSSTYRQSPVISHKKMQQDPRNHYYARAPRYRLDAEQIRDLALKSSNLLHQQIGGPSVKPYSPNNIWSAVAMKTSNTKKYIPDTGSKLYRRSLYTFLKRTAMHPTMEILNAPDRNTSCVQRDLTNTPLQALVIMNDPQFIEASRQLATIAILQASNTKQRANTIAQRLLSRNMQQDEIAIIDKTLKNVVAKFKAKPTEATKLINVGESKPPPELDPTELASWTIIANQILNMDETLNK